MLFWSNAKGILTHVDSACCPYFVAPTDGHSTVEVGEYVLKHNFRL